MKKVILFLGIILSITTFSRDITISLATLPIMSEDEEEGLYYKLIKEMNNYYDDGEIKIIGSFPFKRSIFNVTNGLSDAHLPVLKNNNMPDTELEYTHVDEKLYNVIFVLYSLTSKPDLDINNINKYKIGTEFAQVHLFDFAKFGSHSVKQSLILLENNRLDGYLFSQYITDLAIRDNNYTNIKKQLFEIYEVRFIVRKNKEGEKVNRILTNILKQMHDDGTMEKIFGYYYTRIFTPEILEKEVLFDDK